MTPGSALAVQNSAEVQALIDAQNQEFQGDEFLNVPILKVTQATTKEVKAGDAEAGEFLNSLTGDSYGDRVEFIVAYAQPGRGAAHKDGRYRNVIDQELIPDDQFWKDLLGEQFVGTPFDEHPDAEEQYKIRVNSGEIKWEKGPLISTTYNYTGFVVPSAAEDDLEEPEPLPVRVSFARSTKSAHTTLRQIQKMVLRNKPFWAVVFELSTATKDFGRNTSYIVNVKKSRNTSPEEQQLATELAVAVAGGRVADNAEKALAGDDKAEAPKPSKGALKV